MEKRLYKITKKDLYDLFTRLSSDYRVLVPYVKGGRLNFDDFDIKKENSIELGGIRQSQPLKSFINPPRESILREAAKDPRPLLIAGAKGCDLSGLFVQDHVFLDGGVEDPFYAKSRSRTFIISCDCTYAKETCFCLAMEGRPYAQKYFDINLSSQGDKFLVEAGSDRGLAMIGRFRMFFKPSEQGEPELRDSDRSKVTEEMQGFINARGTQDTSQIKGAVKKNYNLTGLWQDFAATCVECGACNLVCPTCHCFLIFDEKAPDRNERYRAWDACLYKTFARVAGGANPRKHLYERLRNRFEKKFDYFPEVLGHFACTGCGRCIEACPGDIDLREVLKGLVAGDKWNKPPND